MKRYIKLNDDVKREMLKCSEIVTEKLIKFFSMKNEKYTYFSSSNKFFINSFLPSISGGAWNRLLAGINGIANENKRIPLQADIVVTGKCYCKCWHCFRAEYETEDMPFEKIIDCIYQLHRMGTANIGITGGEPMLRADIMDILKSIPEGMEGQLYTTGIGIDAAFVKELEKTNVTRCIISLDHFNEEKVCLKRNNNQAFVNALNAFKLLKESNIYTTATLCVTEELLEEEFFKKYMNFTKSLGISEVRLVMQIPQGMLKEKNLGRVYGKALNFVKNIQEFYNQDESYPTVLNFSEFESFRYFGCGAGSSYITINNDGRITPCVAVPLSFGSVYEESISDIYTNMEKYFPCTNGVCYGIASGNVIKKQQITIDIPPLSYQKSIEVAQKCDIVSREAAVFKACKCNITMEKN